MYPITTIKILNNRFTLTGFSRAGEATSIIVPEMDMVLDAGTIVSTSKFQHIFITHSHLDHSFHIPMLYSHTSSLPRDIYVPLQSLTYFENYLSSSQALNDHDEEKAREICTKRYKLHGVSDGQMIGLGKLYQVEVISCNHTVPCVGYAFYENRMKLKSDYANLSGKEIQELRKQGINVSEQVSIPLFAFLGDTTPEVFAAGSNSARVLLERMPVVICECTFLDGEQTHEKGHTHWSGLKPVVEQYPHITFILIHFSLKYKRSEIEEFFTNQSLKNVIPFI